jgi:hypothetical protein
MALALRDFEVLREGVAAAVDYAEEHEDRVLGIPGLVTQRVLRELRRVLGDLDDIVERLRAIRNQDDGNDWRLERVRVAALDDSLQAELREMRAGILLMRTQVAHDAPPQPPMWRAISSHGIRIIDRALVGTATRDEVLEQVEAVEDLMRWRAQRGDRRYAHERESWLGVFCRLADALPTPFVVEGDTA